MKNKISKRPLNNRQFLARWVTGHALSWLAAVVVAIPFFMIGEFLFPIFPDILNWFLPIAIGLGMGSATAKVQQATIRRRFGINLHGWMRWSVLAWIISAGLAQITSTLYPENFTQVAAAQGIILFTIPALVQGWMLRKYLQNAWLYVLASIAGAVTFALPVAASDGAFPAVIFGYGLYAAVLGLTVIWMFGMAGISPDEQTHRDTSHLAYPDENDDDDDDHWHNQNKHKSYLIQG